MNQKKILFLSFEVNKKIEREKCLNTVFAGILIQTLVYMFKRFVFLNKT